MGDKLAHDYLVQVKELSKHYAGAGKLLHNRPFRAVDDVSFNMNRGETFGLVGESGCGKSTLARLILNLTPASYGNVYFENDSIYDANRRKQREVRKEMQIVFQDPYDSLNPRLTLEEIVAEPLLIHHADKQARSARIKKLFSDVGLPEKLMKRYPHQLSGGQRQRLCIARSLALSPKLLVCDEAVSALDVSIQAQILNLLLDLKGEHGLTYLFISHNLSVVKYVSDRIGVMYFGRLVEIADKKELFENCMHPYTCALLSAVPVPDPLAHKKRVLLKGESPNLYDPPEGCIFCERCAYATDECKKTRPKLKEVAPGHEVACHRAGKLELSLYE